MLTIKTPGMTIQRDANDLMSATPTMDSIYFKFKDGIEVIIPYARGQNSNQIDAVLRMASQQDSARNVSFDFTSRQILSIS